MARHLPTSTSPRTSSPLLGSQRRSSTKASNSSIRRMLLSCLTLVFALDLMGNRFVGVEAAGESLSTESVAYCSDAQAILVNQFDISYFRANHSAVFFISAASVESNLNLEANIYVNAYGSNLLNLTIDLCSILSGVLCPLPQINFTGYGTYPLPASYENKIPSIAWSVPDLEAFAQITLTDTSSGNTAACLQATLSNGWTTRQKGVEIGTAVFFLVSLLVGAIFTTLWASPSPTIYRWYDILYLFQTAAASGLLQLNYPEAYLNFTLNFSWALGLFSNGNIENAINQLRNKTGGKLSNVAFPAVDYINRKLSPYNEAIALDVNTVISNVSTAADYKSLISRAAGAYDSSAGMQIARRATIPTVSTTTSTNNLETGVPVYLNSLGIPTANGFDTIFFTYLIAMAVFLGLHAIWFVIVFAADLLRGREKRGTGWAGRQRKGFFTFLGGNTLRLLLILYFPITIFAFYQFVIGSSDSWLSILLAALTLAWTILPLLIILGLSIRRSRKNFAEPVGVSPLYTRFRWFNSAGMIYRQYRQKYHFWWVVPLALATFAKAGFIGFGAGQPWAQVIGLLVVELLVLITYIIFRPHKDKKGDVLTIFLSIMRMIAFGLLIAFIPSVGVSAIIRTIIGIVLIAVYGIPVVLLLFGFFFNIGFGLLWRRHRERIEDGTEVVIPWAETSETSSQEPAMRQVDLLGGTATTGEPLAAHHPSNGASYSAATYDGASDSLSHPQYHSYGNMPSPAYEPQRQNWADPNRPLSGASMESGYNRPMSAESYAHHGSRKPYGAEI